MLHPTVFKSEDLPLWDGCFDLNYTRPVIRDFHNQRMCSGARVLNSPFLRRKEPVKPPQKRGLLFICPGELSAMKWNLNKTQSTDSTVEQKHVSNISS